MWLICIYSDFKWRLPSIIWVGLIQSIANPRNKTWGISEEKSCLSLQTTGLPYRFNVMTTISAFWVLSLPTLQLHDFELPMTSNFVSQSFKINLSSKSLTHLLFLIYKCVCVCIIHVCMIYTHTIHYNYLYVNIIHICYTYILYVYSIILYI